MATVLLALAETLYVTKEHEQARIVLTTLGGYDRSENVPLRVKAAFLEANVAASLGQFASAREASEQGLSLAKTQFGGDSLEYARALSEAARISHREGANE
jgi:hypothetical protein